MDEDLIVLGAPAETQAAGGEASPATEAPEGTEAATPGTEPVAPTAAPKPDASQGEGEDGEPEGPKKRNGYQRAKEKIARLEAELAATRNAPAGASGDRQAVIEKEIGAPPKEADFDDYALFERAQRQYDVRLALAEQRAADREAQTSTRAEQANAEAIEAFHDRCDELRSKLPNFDAALASAKDRPISAHVQDLVVESEKGGLLAYYLATNPAELEKLNRMSERQAAKVVGALEHRLTLHKPNRTPAAPAPAKPVSGAAAPGPDPSKMSFAEYEAWRKGKP